MEKKKEILDWKLHFYVQCYFMGFHQNFERSSSLKQLLFEDIGFRKVFVSWLANMELFTFIASLKLFGISYMQE